MKYRRIIAICILFFATLFSTSVADNYNVNSSSNSGDNNVCRGQTNHQHSAHTWSNGRKNKTANKTTSQDWVPDEIVVKFKHGVSQERTDEINSRHGTRELYTSPSAGFKKLHVPQGKTCEEMVSLYSCENDVEYAELNYYVYALFVPNDPLYAADQWNLSDAFAGINMQPAWDITKGDPNVIVAVVDTGVAFENHNGFQQAPDLAQTHFVPGYNFVSGTTHPNDDEGHGTHVTGTIAQSTNNNLGVAGIAFNCSIMPVKVLDSAGSGTDTDVADGIMFAANNNAKVINLSLGSAVDTSTIRNAVAYAYGHGVTIICAAGNDFQMGDPPIYPAAYDAYCIAVGATGINRNHASYSNTGSYLDVVAPGGDSSAGIIQQTFQGSPTNFGYLSFQGTSMATPHVSGIAALLISHGTVGPDAVREAIQNTARDLGTTGWDSTFGWGLVDANAALTYRHLPGDFNRDGVVDFNDLEILASFWLQNHPATDIWPANGDGVADLRDYAVFASEWLMHAH